MEIRVMEPRTVEARTLQIRCKVRDCFNARLVDSEGRILKDHEGYVPGFMPGRHYGDYLILDVDIDTGQITNWKVPTAKQIEEFVGSEEE